MLSQKNKGGVGGVPLRLNVSPNEYELLLLLLLLHAFISKKINMSMPRFKSTLTDA